MSGESAFSDPIEREVWATVCTMNDAWTKGDPADLQRYFHRDMIAITPVDRLMHLNGDACIAGWAGFAESARILHWRELEPVIRIYGNAAVVAYYFDMSFAIDEQTLHSAGRDLLFMVKEDGRWQIVADQFSPYPA